LKDWQLMVRKLLKTTNNKEQIRFILACSRGSWKLGNKVARSRYIARTINKSNDLCYELATNKKFIRKS
jgi:hypothetical protein